MKKQKNLVVGVRFDPSSAAALKKRAKAERLPLSTMIRVFVERMVIDQEKKTA